MWKSDFLKANPEYKMGILRLTLFGLLGKERDTLEKMKRGEGSRASL